ncbi:hypothetical protein HY522_11315 [bacterium]|nr:hypothetical protein [bacterium]
MGAALMAVLMALTVVLGSPDAAEAKRRSLFSIFIGKDLRLQVISKIKILNPDTYLTDGSLSVTLVSPITYKLRYVYNSDYYYLDRGFILTSVPGYISGKVWIVGLDDDKLVSTPDYVQFDISDNARVYVLYDANATSLPSWMSAFSNTGDVVTTSNPAVPTMNVYLAVLPLGTVRLGGNEGSTTGAQGNYVVVVRRPKASDQASEAEVAATEMVVPRIGHRVMTLNNGRVLVAGGVDTDGVLVTRSELYDSVPQTFILSGNMTQGRINPAIVKLNDGRAMLIGGDQGGTPQFNDGNSVTWGITALASCEFFDAATQAWTAGPNMAWRRRLPEAVKLADGRIFVAGGVEDTGGHAIRSTEIFDPVLSTWTAGPDLITARYGHKMALLADGRVFIAGGMINGPDLIDIAVPDCEIYDPALGTVASAAPMVASRSRFGFVDIGGNRFQASGGLSYQRPSPPASTPFFISTADVEIYDASTNVWTSAAPLPRSMYDFAVVSPGYDRVLIFDGFDVQGTDAGDILLYDNVLNNWTLVGSLVNSRSFPFSNGADMVTDVGGKDYFLCGGAHFSSSTGVTTYLYTGERFKY